MLPVQAPPLSRAGSPEPTPAWSPPSPPASPIIRPQPPRQPTPPRDPTPVPLNDTSFLNFANPAKCREQAPPRPAASPSPEPQDFFAGGRSHQQQPRPPHATIEDEKESIIIELIRLQPDYSRPIPKFTMSSPVAEMRLQLRLVKEELEATEGIQFYESFSLLQTGLTERLNQHFNPFDLDMSGLSEHHHSSIHLFRKVFRRMHSKYGTPTKNPVVEYLVVYFGMVYAYVITKRYAEQLNTDEVRAAMAQMAQGAQNQAPPGPSVPGMGNIQQMLQTPQMQQILQQLGQGQGGQLQEMLQQFQPPQAQQQQQPQPQVQLQQQPQPQPQPQFRAQAAPPPPPQARPAMKPPSFTPPPAPLTRQDSGFSAAPTEESQPVSDGSSKDGIKEVRLRGKGRGGRRGRGRNVTLL